MIHAFWHSIGSHAGTFAWHLGPFLLLALSLMWFRRAMRNLRRSTKRGGGR